MIDLYRLAMTLAAPLILRRQARRGESMADRSERLGKGGGTPGAIWLHGASNGELTSARPLIDAVRAAFPDRRLVVTANTVTGRDMVRGWGLPGVDARLAPLDIAQALRNFRTGWRPAALVVLENELWPLRIATETAPILCVGARMSERSARRWARVPGLMAPMLRRIGWLSAQDDGSARRFVRLGLPAERLGPTGTLKAAVALPVPDPEALVRLAPPFRRGNTVLAASTHAGEEDIVLEAFARARQTDGDLRLILAPRHPARGAEVEARARGRGFDVAVRSRTEPPGAPVYLADTLGEMALWYTLARATFVGGSLVDRGGHTPFEPAQFGSAIVHGPHVANFAAAYAALDRDGGALPVTDARSLAAALLTGPDESARIAARATGVLGAFGGDAVIRAAVEALDAALSRPGASG